MHAAAKTMAADLRDHLLQVLRDQCGTKPFRDLDEGDQAQIKGNLEWEVAGAVRKAVAAIASMGFDNVAVQVDAVTIKKDVKLGFVLTERSAAALDILARSYGKEALVVFADPALFMQAQGDLFDGAAAADEAAPAQEDEEVEHDEDGVVLEEDGATEVAIPACGPAFDEGAKALCDKAVEDGLDPATATIVAAVAADVAANGSTDPASPPNMLPEESDEPDRHVTRGIKVGGAAGRPVRGRRKSGNVFAGTAH